ncbi:hypothetical protein SAY86_015216 [Trapa natans]|uniref:DUF7086 domain-containing protein n=1 Tax=Trapa natans TaxID=22666 RepID=A0AAN7KNP7_TRANT|nr:hypothetical protein SAY86_015216 [Trapa natans]
MFIFIHLLAVVSLLHCASVMDFNWMKDQLDPFIGEDYVEEVIEEVEEEEEEDDSVYIDLELSLSIGPSSSRKRRGQPLQPPPKRREIAVQPPCSTPIVFLALSPSIEPAGEVDFFMSRAFSSSWRLPTDLQELMLFQAPPSQDNDTPVQTPSFPPPPPPPPPPAPPLPPPPQSQGGGAPTEDPRPPRAPRNLQRVSGTGRALNWRGKDKTITPPYPWATDRRAMLHPYAYLISNGMTKITGEMQCRRCEMRFEMEYDLEEKFAEVSDYIAENRSTMHERAPDVWMNPVVPDCPQCSHPNCVRPLPTKKKAINWLFLLLSRFLGCCKLSELKYFCKHTNHHRTAAKDRVLYITYLGICRQLDPSGPFSL